MPLDIELDWDLIDDDRAHRWTLSRVLYALCHPETDQILYLGKAEWEIDSEHSDAAIAQAAIARLRSDCDRGLNHLVMARCDSIGRADHVHAIYQRLAPEFAPVSVHSEAPNAHENLERMRTGQSRIVVCVDMLGEGFDLPQLKIAAIHDTHKSLAVLLQFAGRFTRVAGTDIGNATAIANIANQDVSSALERLYSEDADWNHLLSEASSEAVREHTELIQFLRGSTRLDENEGDEAVPISSSLLRPKFSVAVYRTGVFRPRQFHAAVADNQKVAAAWLNEQSGTLFDDDDSGEAADLVCVTEEADCIRLALVHCKFTTAATAGERVKDVVEVCSQAIRSAKWLADFKRLCRHITERETRLRHADRPTRFLTGNTARLNTLLRASRFKPVRAEIVIVQPGLSQQACTVEQTAVLAAAHSYLLETVAVPLDIVCSV